MDFNGLSPANTDIKPTVCGTKNYNEVNDPECEFNFVYVHDKLQSVV